MTLINDKKLSPLYGQTNDNPTCHYLAEGEWNDTIASFLKEGFNNGYSKTYVATEILKMVENYPENAQNALMPNTYEGISKQVVEPLYPAYKNPVYQCIRPLAAFGEKQEGKKTGDETKDNPLYHQFTCVNPNEKYAELKCSGLTNSLFPYSYKGPGEATHDEFDTQYCELVTDSQCLSDCIEDEWENKKPFYNLAGPGTNCQEYDINIHEVCDAKCKE